tara:strand:+ start:1547 stop:1918 length:372 start_codon:yes stop_codon:yes gene_type:complete
METVENVKQEEIPDFVVSDDIFAEAGITREQADEGATQVHELGVAAAIRAATMFQWEVNADAYSLKDIETGAGRLVAEFDYDEYIWLKLEYPGCMESKEFIEDYQRLRGQTFLAKPSSEYGNS